MGFHLFRERMGEELYLKKMKEADEVCEVHICLVNINPRS